jgi:cytoskeleton protein RodZ
MADIGATLREARMRARIDITEVETRTKIRAKYLRAMENEEWDLLPGEIYVKSFLRTYGDYLGLDTRQLIDDFKRRYERPSDHELRPITPPRARERDRRPRGPRVPPWALIGAVLVLVVAALWIVGNNATKTGKPTPTTSARTPRRHARKHRGRRRITIPVAKTPTTVKLQLVPTGKVYVCVVDGTGKKLIPGLIYDVGSPIPTETSAKLLLTLGNNSVTMKVNGKTVPVPASSASIGFELSPSGSAPLPVSKQPRCT